PAPAAPGPDESPHRGNPASAAGHLLDPGSGLSAQGGGRAATGRADPAARPDPDAAAATAGADAEHPLCLPQPAGTGPQPGTAGQRPAPRSGGSVRETAGRLP